MASSINNAKKDVSWSACCTGICCCIAFFANLLWGSASTFHQPLVQANSRPRGWALLLPTILNSDSCSCMLASVARQRRNCSPFQASGPAKSQPPNSSHKRKLQNPCELNPTFQSQHTLEAQRTCPNEPPLCASLFALDQKKAENFSHFGVPTSLSRLEARSSWATLLLTSDLPLLGGHAI